MHKLIYLYILECNDGSYYTGVTSNLDKRVIEHNSGMNKESYTFQRRPVLLRFHQTFWDFNLAFRTETRIKKWSHRKKKALIEGEFELLVKLSKKKFGKRRK